MRLYKANIAIEYLNELICARIIVISGNRVRLGSVAYLDDLVVKGNPINNSQRMIIGTTKSIKFTFIYAPFQLIVCLNRHW